jgi:hypothetical protein
MEVPPAQWGSWCSVPFGMEFVMRLGRNQPIKLITGDAFCRCPVFDGPVSDARPNKVPKGCTLWFRAAKQDGSTAVVSLKPGETWSIDENIKHPKARISLMHRVRAKLRCLYAFRSILDVRRQMLRRTVTAFTVLAHLKNLVDKKSAQIAEERKELRQARKRRREEERIAKRAERRAQREAEAKADAFRLRRLFTAWKNFKKPKEEPVKTVTVIEEPVKKKVNLRPESLLDYMFVLRRLTMGVMSMFYFNLYRFRIHEKRRGVSEILSSAHLSAIRFMMDSVASTFLLTKNFDKSHDMSCALRRLCELPAANTALENGMHVEYILSVLYDLPFMLASLLECYFGFMHVYLSSFTDPDDAVEGLNVMYELQKSGKYHCSPSETVVSYLHQLDQAFVMYNGRCANHWKVFIAAFVQGTVDSMWRTCSFTSLYHNLLASEYYHFGDKVHPAALSTNWATKFHPAAPKPQTVKDVLKQRLRQRIRAAR